MRFFGVTICGLLFTAAPLFAQSITIKADSLNCTTSLGTNTFQGLTWNFNVSNSASSGSGSGTSGKAAFSVLNITKNFDQCSPALFSLVPSGTHLTTVTLTQYDANNIAQMSVQLTTAFVTSYQVTGSTSANPTESISLSYSIMAITDAVNGVKSCWNVLANNSSCS